MKPSKPSSVPRLLLRHVPSMKDRTQAPPFLPPAHPPSLALHGSASKSRFLLFLQSPRYGLPHITQWWEGNQKMKKRDEKLRPTPAAVRYHPPPFFPFISYSWARPVRWRSTKSTSCSRRLSSIWRASAHPPPEVPPHHLLVISANWGLRIQWK